MSGMSLESSKKPLNLRKGGFPEHSNDRKGNIFIRVELKVQGIIREGHYKSGQV